MILISYDKLLIAAATSLVIWFASRAIDRRHKKAENMMLAKKENVVRFVE